MQKLCCQPLLIIPKGELVVLFFVERIFIWCYLLSLRKIEHIRANKDFLF